MGVKTKVGAGPKRMTQRAGKRSDYINLGKKKKRHGAK